MEVQIFGLRKSADTRKALRFFAERRIRAHFVDLAERPIADGELRRFVQRFGLDGVLDRDSKRFGELGLRHARITEAQWLVRVAAEPAVLRLPLVRRLGQPSRLSVGPSDPAWQSWVDSAKKTTL